MDLNNGAQAAVMPQGLPAWMTNNTGIVPPQQPPMNNGGGGGPEAMHGLPFNGNMQQFLEMLRARMQQRQDMRQQHGGAGGMNMPAFGPGNPLNTTGGAQAQVAKPFAMPTAAPGQNQPALAGLAAQQPTAQMKPQVQAPQASAPGAPVGQKNAVMPVDGAFAKYKA